MVILLRLAANKILSKDSFSSILLGSLLLFSACSPDGKDAVDKLNSISYAYHYRNLDSTAAYADRALRLAVEYGDGKAEAVNNMAFVEIARMNYDKADSLLGSVPQYTDNQVELLVADIQHMRLCQRKSSNRQFYEYREKALSRLKRIEEEKAELSEHLSERMIYAETEFAIVSSAYFYYVGLLEQASDAILSIDGNGEIRKDTAQYLNYLYNIGSGGILIDMSSDEMRQEEFEYLVRCLVEAREGGYKYFEANALESLGEHLLDAKNRATLINDNPSAMPLICTEPLDESLLSGYLTEQSLAAFSEYGDVYQIAGAQRSLASCYMGIDDYQTALYHLEDALADTIITQAPDLVASIREQLCVVYSALDNKQMSDYNRNIYLDLQDQSRQDRYYEARADMLDREVAQLNLMLGAVIIAIVILVFLLWLFNFLNKRLSGENTMEKLLQPLYRWQKTNEKHLEEQEERLSEINEEREVGLVSLHGNERRNLENRAKVSLVNSVTPLIDRIINEVDKLEGRDENNDVKADRHEYIIELADKINEYNDLLTQWIQMRQGKLSLKIESFSVGSLFNIVRKGKTGFQIKGVTLTVDDTGTVVKADRVLTLFMINTLADNARKFTQDGGFVHIYATEGNDYVEISVEDTGKGMSEDELSTIFEHKIYNGHGFGLMNCRGIIEKYKKISQKFACCTLSAESKEGEGSRFFFRLPKGIARCILLLFFSISSLCQVSAVEENMGGKEHMIKAAAFADSAYFSNIEGTYSRTIEFADSCRNYLNKYYQHLQPDGKLLMLHQGKSNLIAPEIKWYQDSLPLNYNIILDIRNESAVAALALHQWDLYDYNNSVYTRLYKEMSADNTLADYCNMMRKSQNDKNMAIVILVIVLVMILPAYYMLYYRHRLYYRFCLERVKRINSILETDSSPDDKLRQIREFANGEYPERLRMVVGRIEDALNDAVRLMNSKVMSIEMAEDEKHRVEYEDNNLHISNSVLDNCLSTLKHETMYYPSRIKQLISSQPADMKSVSEIVEYYRDIYSILSMQAMQQFDRVKIQMTPVAVDELFGKAADGEPLDDAIAKDTSCDKLMILGNKNLLRYFFEILRKKAKTSNLQVEAKAIDDRYVRLTVTIDNLNLDETAAQNLFTPQSMDSIPYLLCRQIVRDHSEMTNRRGCGINARTNNGKTLIDIVLPRYIKQIK